MKTHTEVDINSLIVDHLVNLGLPFKELEKNMWTITDEANGVDNLVIIYEQPIVILRVNLTKAPTSNKEAFFEKLLRLNAESMVHGAYALEGDNIVLVDTLEAENLDFNELQASVESIIMAVRTDYKELSKF